MSEYTPAQRAEAVALYSEVGPSEVERRLGIPKGTVTKWAQAVGAETVSSENTQKRIEAAQLKWAERREAMVHDIGATAELAMARTHDAIVAGMGRDAKDYATTMAILVDKAQLLSGGATQRTETFGRTELAAKAAELDELAKRRAAKSA